MPSVLVVSLDAEDGEAMDVVREIKGLAGVEDVLLCTDTQARAVRRAVDL